MSKKAEIQQLYQNACKVTIEGTGMGILLHSPAGMGAGGKSAKKEIHTPEADAAASAYWTRDKSSLAFPGWNIYRALVAGCAGMKVPGQKRMALAPIIAGDVEIGPEMVPFGTKEYEIDTRRAVVQRQGIPRSRPLLRQWQLTFEVHWESSTLGKDFHETILPELLVVVGQRVGLGDFRPQCRGPFGRFRVVSVEKV